MALWKIEIKIEIVLSSVVSFSCQSSEKHNVVKNYFQTAEESYHYVTAVWRGKCCVEVTQELCSGPLLLVNRKKLSKSHSFQRTADTFQKGIRWLLLWPWKFSSKINLLVMLFFFSPSAIFNNCVTVLKIPSMMVKGEILRIRPQDDYILVELCI